MSHLTEMMVELDLKAQADYANSEEIARADPQQSGHIAKTTWKLILQRWLLAGYAVGVRKYIVPELNDDSFETDIVVFRPSVPEVIREEAQIPHGAVAAAFFVRRTADRAGLADAAERAARLRRSMDRAILGDTPRIMPAYPIGFLALSHSWKSPPVEAASLVTGALLELDQEFAQTPEETLDLCCIGELGAWRQSRMPSLPTMAFRLMVKDDTAQGGFPMTTLLDPVSGEGELRQSPVGLFIRELYSAVESNDPGLSELAYSLRKGVSWPDGYANVRLWLPDN